ncbi:hypothetical protein BKP35_12205 [Anaerobacillus arseniciselenatis]|uniref:Uncharacterized protein n=1 Tax=Anaerobacillus arseniciselenatis TaxID=85682 RepID=A0A1S2LG40_9BACI|nr:hypothetical protein [Anaerobacillus arseniciselenatis]OIJ11499.1 hypothetical protein BKP35_12205 [Anaerobacillus arseniciselenatis]
MIDRLSNFEKGFCLYIQAIKSPMINRRYAPITRKLNEAICLMASEDVKLMKKIVVNQWVINRALSSSYAEKYCI